MQDFRDDSWEDSFMSREIKVLQNYFKENNTLLNIFECGCAATVSNTLMSIPGASNMIDTCTQIYSKDSQIKRYGEFKRSVSKEFTELVLKSEPYKTAIAISFQIQDTSNPVMQTHGWVSVTNNVDMTRNSYHISYNNNHHSREDILIDIAKDVVKILTHFFIDRKHKLSNVDMVYSGRFLSILDYETLFNSADENSIIAFNSQGEISRWEEMVRGFDGLILMRGSFNPIHKRHLESIEKTKEKYPEYKAFLHCSIKRFDKPDLTLDEIKEKVAQAYTNGLPIIFTTEAKFNPALNLIRERYKGEIVLPVGIDTINRFVDSEVESEISLNKSFSNMFAEIAEKHKDSENALMKTISKNSSERKEKTVDEIMQHPSLFHFGSEAWEKQNFLSFKEKI